MSLGTCLATTAGGRGPPDPPVTTFTRQPPGFQAESLGQTLEDWNREGADADGKKFWRGVHKNWALPPALSQGLKQRQARIGEMAQQLRQWLLLENPDLSLAPTWCLRTITAAPGRLHPLWPPGHMAYMCVHRCQPHIQTHNINTKKAVKSRAKPAAAWEPHVWRVQEVGRQRQPCRIQKPSVIWKFLPCSSGWPPIHQDPSASAP